MVSYHSNAHGGKHWCLILRQYKPRQEKKLKTQTGFPWRCLEKVGRGAPFQEWMRIWGFMSAPQSQHSLWAGCYGGILSCVTLRTRKQNSRSKFQSMIIRRETTWRTWNELFQQVDKGVAKEGRLASWPGFEPVAPTLGAQGLSHWANQAAPQVASWITENTQGLRLGNNQHLSQPAPPLGGHSLWLPQAWFLVSATWRTSAVQENLPKSRSFLDF